MRRHLSTPTGNAGGISTGLSTANTDADLAYFSSKLPTCNNDDIIEERRVRLADTAERIGFDDDCQRCHRSAHDDIPSAKLIDSLEKLPSPTPPVRRSTNVQRPSTLPQRRMTTFASKRRSADGQLYVDWMFVAKIVDFFTFFCALMSVIFVPFVLFTVIPPTEPDLAYLFKDWK